MAFKACSSTKLIRPTYETCLNRVLAATSKHSSYVDEKIAKMAGLLFEVELTFHRDVNENELKLQKAETELKSQKVEFETKIIASNAKFQSDLSFLSKRYMNNNIMMYIYISS